MTYTLDTLQSSSRRSKSASVTEPTPATKRLSQELLLVLGAVALIYWIISLITHSAADAAWSTSGSTANGIGLHNWGGKLGAYLSDASFYFLGYSIWWCVLAAGRKWMAALANWLRGEHTATNSRARLIFWLSLALLLAASCTLEWSRLYRFETRLPGHAGGVLGFWLGGLASQWLGFNGSALLAIVLLLVGTGATLRFSWAHGAERIGGLILGRFEKWRERLELKEDLEFGTQAAKQREETVNVERAEIEELHAAPVILPKAMPVQIEPVLTDSFVDVPQSTRVAKERQKGLFAELPDSKLPQVDLLDGAPVGRQETVSPETLEMTSRMIEKKLKDFGVTVQVVAAMPGPVVTRYEIEPATGVKGSQIVGLAKDLARSLSLVSIRVVETIPGKNFMALELPNPCSPWAWAKTSWATRWWPI
jgi:DNA segregation ATPase FtsK/SpoIIIE, S-DNA-T family